MTETSSQPESRKSIDVFLLHSSPAGERTVFAKEHKMPSGLTNVFEHSLFVYQDDIQVDDLPEELRVEEFTGLIEGVVIPGMAGQNNVDLDGYLRISPSGLLQVSDRVKEAACQIQTLGKYPVFSQRIRKCIDLHGREIFSQEEVNLVS